MAIIKNVSYLKSDKYLRISLAKGFNKMKTL